MNRSDYSSSNGINFLGLLTIVFITLKLTDYIDWSWWWVFSPIWLPIVILIVGVFAVSVVKAIFKK